MRVLLDCLYKESEISVGLVEKQLICGCGYFVEDFYKCPILDHACAEYLPTLRIIAG